MSRALKNPYPDRTLSVNLFQLIKHFSVETTITEVRSALIFRLTGLTFDNGCGE